MARLLLRANYAQNRVPKIQLLIVVESVFGIHMSRAVFKYKVETYRLLVL